MFKDRHHAAMSLLETIENFPLDKSNTVVVGLPRGGVPVASVLAQKLDLPLEIICVKKIGYPGNPELAFGAATESGEFVINSDIRRMSNLREDEIEELLDKHILIAKAKATRLRQGRAMLNLKDKDILLVDDGIATGATVEAAIKMLKHNKVNEIIVVTPLASEESVARISPQVDKVIVLETPSPFLSVGRWYRSFEPVSDIEVERILDQCQVQDQNKYQINITLNCNGQCLDGKLVKVSDEKAWVVFVHGSGSSHLSPRNNWVASELNAAGFSTLLFDLLTPQEDSDYNTHFDIDLLTERLVLAIKWLIHSDHFSTSTPIGLFGASTGAAAALVAAAKYQDEFPLYSIVSRGGRPDLAGEHNLRDIMLPTLLLVGSRDFPIIEYNEKAKNQIYNSQMQLIANATHLFEEPGTLEKVAELTTNWFQQQLPDSTNLTHQRHKSNSLGEIGHQL